MFLILNRSHSTKCGESKSTLKSRRLSCEPISGRRRQDENAKNENGNRRNVHLSRLGSKLVKSSAELPVSLRSNYSDEADTRIYSERIYSLKINAIKASDALITSLFEYPCNLVVADVQVEVKDAFRSYYGGIIFVGRCLYLPKYNMNRDMKCQLELGASRRSLRHD
jgi:hypothetical protein